MTDRPEAKHPYRREYLRLRMQLESLAHLRYGDRLPDDEKFGELIFDVLNNTRDYAQEYHDQWCLKDDDGNVIVDEDGVEWSDEGCYICHPLLGMEAEG